MEDKIKVIQDCLDVLIIAHENLMENDYDKIKKIVDEYLKMKMYDCSMCK